MFSAPDLMLPYLYPLTLSLLLQGTEAPPPVYEAILRQLREQHPGKAIVLNTNVSNFTCLKRCEGPLVTGTHSKTWLGGAKRRGVIDGACTPRPSDRVCIRHGTGAPVQMERGVEVLLSTTRVREDGTVEAAASFHTANEGGRVYGETIRYVVAKSGDCWSVVAATVVERIN